MTICETDDQSKFEASNRALKAGALGWDALKAQSDGMGSGWGTHVHPWLIQVNAWQKPPPEYKVISFQLKSIN